jgi:pimeloyl-[acyl-carrier protein] methyl ester esterase
MDDITFIHGWGYNPAFWQALTPAFSQQNQHFADMGFLSRKALSTTGRGIYITHSLGTLHALHHHSADMSALIVINGFYDFTHFTDEKILKLMMRALDRAPLAQMQAFWRQCGLTPEFEKLNVPALREGLDALAQDNAQAELDAIDIPVLCLAAEDDPITPFDAMKDHWRGFPLISCTEGGHILAHSRAEWCAAQIKDFMHDHKLEY